MRVTDGARTRDLRGHIPALCQLSYGHQGASSVAQTAGGLASAGSLGQRAPVAQLDRADGFYPSGCAFESCRGRKVQLNRCLSGGVDRRARCGPGPFGIFEGPDHLSNRQLGWMHARGVRSPTGRLPPVRIPAVQTADSGSVDRSGFARPRCRLLGVRSGWNWRWHRCTHRDRRPDLCSATEKVVGAESNTECEAVLATSAGPLNLSDISSRATRLTEEPGTVEMSRGIFDTP